MTVQTTPAVAGQIVTLSAEAVQNSGGHFSHSSTRPTGTFTATQGTTNANGVFETSYTAPIFGGTMMIRGTMRSVSKQQFLNIYITGMQELGSGSNYVLTGATTTHPANHFGTALAVANLPQIANDYKAVYPTSADVEFNDMSLINGGKFEIPGSWSETASHQEHKLGKNCDIPYGKPNLIQTTEQQSEMENILRRYNSRNFLKHVAPDPLHYHARFEP
uniref:Uncharacterized protein n=1 Tax=Oscillatoriales cyanobacterium SpSt-418 TaxID=2282169 RepID=A0A7C3KBG3_9CYAN